MWTIKQKGFREHTEWPWFIPIYVSCKTFWCILITDIESLGKSKTWCHTIGFGEPSRNKLQFCASCLLYVPEGVTPHSVYPSDIHRSQTYPWTFECSDKLLVICSTNCTCEISPMEAQCQPGSTLLSKDVIPSINEWNKNGIQDNTPYKWYMMADLIGLL